jgi:hypothetical protein
MDRFFAGLGLRRLHDLVSSGDLSSLSDFQVENYAKFAAMWDGPPIVLDGTDVRAGARAHFSARLFQVLVGQGPDYTEVDGEPYLDTPDGPRHVGPDELCHLERMVTLLSDEETARAFLALAPEWARSEAQNRAAQVWDMAFFDIAGRAE